MTARAAKSRVIFDMRQIATLPSGTKVREIGVHGRTFIIDQHTPGRVWYGEHGEHPCPIHALDMPVEVIAS